MSALALLGWLLLALAGLLILLLVVPLRLSLHVASDPPALDVRVGWPVRWLPDVRLNPRARRKPGPSAATTGQARRGPGARRGRPGQSLLPRALGALPGLLGGLLRALHIRRLCLSARFGAGDPALTGRIYGACTPLIFGTAGSDRFDLRLEPDFNRACLSAEGLAVLQVRPIALAGPALRFLWACYGPRR